MMQERQLARHMADLRQTRQLGVVYIWVERMDEQVGQVKVKVGCAMQLAAELTLDRYNYNTAARQATRLH